MCLFFFLCLLLINVFDASSSGLMSVFFRLRTAPSGVRVADGAVLLAHLVPDVLAGLRRLIRDGGVHDVFVSHHDGPVAVKVIRGRCRGICQKWHILRYMALGEMNMDQRVARVGKNNRAQVVTIPLEFRFPEGMKEVFIRKVGEEVILSPRPSDWSAFLASNVRASEDFMVGIDDLAVQERSFA